MRRRGRDKMNRGIYKKIIHKSYMTAFNNHSMSFGVCGRDVGYTRLSWLWKNVTCKRCLKARKK